jgi:chemotaxis protein methyltransferase CheR
VWSITITTDEFRLLRDLIEKECGIEVKDEKVYLIENRLAKLVIENGCESFGEFYEKAKHGVDPGLKAKIVDAITTNETLWFRDELPFNILRELVLPELVEKLRSGEKRNVRIWSAASSTGQEPYSMAMLIYEFYRQGKMTLEEKEKFSILATDISSSALMLAKAARYDGISMSRGMLPGFKEQYFEEDGRLCILKDEIKQMVTFEQFNLQNSFATLGSFDVVMLRNVAIYFAHEFKIQLFKKIARLLNPGGYLFLGSSEILSGYSTEFEQKEHGRGIFYQLKT